MNKLFDFLKTASALHSEKRFARLANDDCQSVSSHSWMMSLMAISFTDKLKNPVDMEEADE